MTKKKAALKRSAKRIQPGQDIQVGDRGIAVGEFISESAIIH